jgi:hypothetical protein
MEPVLSLDILIHIAVKYFKKTVMWFVSRALHDAFLRARRCAHVTLYGPRFDTLLMDDTGRRDEKWRQQFLQYQKRLHVFRADAMKRKQQLTLGPISNSYLRHLLHELCEALGLVHESVHNHTSYRTACCRCHSSRIHKRKNCDGYESQDELECDECHTSAYWRFCIDLDVQYKTIVVRRDRTPSKRAVKRAERVDQRLQNKSVGLGLGMS